MKKTLFHKMPSFCLLSINMQVVIGVGTLRVPILHHFPFLLLFATIATIGISYLIVKSGPLRYFFGLPTAKGSLIPGNALKGLVPGIILAIFVIIETIIGNTM